MVWVTLHVNSFGVLTCCHARALCAQAPAVFGSLQRVKMEHKTTADRAAFLSQERDKLVGVVNDIHKRIVRPGDWFKGTKVKS